PPGPDDVPPDAEGAPARINFRVPEALKARIEAAAGAQGRSVNAWLTRAASAALRLPSQSTTNETSAGARAKQHVTGWGSRPRKAKIRLLKRKIEGIPMQKFDTPEPITANIEPGVGSVTVVAADRLDTVVEIRPTNPDNESDVDAAQRTTVDFAGNTLTIRGPKYNPFIGPR